MELNQSEIVKENNLTDQESINDELERQQLKQQLSMLSAIHKQKTDLIENIKKQLSQIEKYSSLNEIKSSLGKVIREIDFSNAMQNDWDYYSKYFEKNNQDFINKISEKLCTLLKLQYQNLIY